MRRGDHDGSNRHHFFQGLKCRRDGLVPSRRYLSRVPDKVAILSGSGLSAESGLPTFRDAAGLWRQHSWQDLASPEGWRRNPGGLVDVARPDAAKILNSLEMDEVPDSFAFCPGPATQVLPRIIGEWLAGQARWPCIMRCG
jgi:hypothetical protein